MTSFTQKALVVLLGSIQGDFGLLLINALEA